MPEEAPVIRTVGISAMISFSLKVLYCAASSCSMSPRWILVCYRDDDFALCAPSLDVGERIASFLERENLIQDRTDCAGFDQGRDFAQLLSLRSHKQE